MKTTTLSLLAGAVLAAAMPVAASELITNGSFEVGTPAGNPNDTSVNSQQLFGGDTLAGWIVTGSSSNDIAWIGKDHEYNLLTASHGDNFLDLTGWQVGGAFAGKGVAQTITTQAGATYTVSFDLGNSIDFNYRYDSVGLNALKVNFGALNQTVSSTVLPTSTNPNNAWRHFDLSFVAQSESTTLSFTGVQATYYIGLDNVSVTAVPEPETYAMLLAGLGVMGAVARRRKAQQA